MREKAVECRFVPCSFQPNTNLLRLLAQIEASHHDGKECRTRTAQGSFGVARTRRRLAEDPHTRVVVAAVVEAQILRLARSELPNGELLRRDIRVTAYWTLA